MRIPYQFSSSEPRSTFSEEQRRLLGRVLKMLREDGGYAIAEVTKHWSAPLGAATWSKAERGLQVADQTFVDAFAFIKPAFAPFLFERHGYGSGPKVRNALLRRVEQELQVRELPSYVLDGEVVRRMMT